MHIVVFGANGPTGRLLTQRALSAGHEVTAVTRHPLLFPLADERLRVVPGDVLDPATTAQAIEGSDAVLSCLGTSFTRKPVQVYSRGAAHITDAMRLHGVRRLVCVSSSAVDPHVQPDAGWLFQHVVQPLIGTFGRTVYEDMRRMEALLRESSLDWTVIRPSGLFYTETTTEYRTAQDFVAGRFTSRADLADCMLRQLSEPEHIRKNIAVATVSEAPQLWRLIMREAFQRRPA